MVLDHTRDFFFGIQIKPTDLSVTTPALFFAVWLIAITLLYPSARWFLRKKRSRPEGFLRYF